MFLERSFRSLRRFVRAAMAPSSAAAIVALAARGDFATPGIPACAVAIVGLVSALSLTHRNARARRADPRIAPMDLGAALISIALAYATAAYLARAAHLTLDAVPFIVVAAASALAGPHAAIAIGAFGMFAEGLGAVLHPPIVVAALVARAVLVLSATAMHHVLTRNEIARVRAHATRLLDDERARQREAARSFRLIAAPGRGTRPSHGDEERRVRGSLDEIRDTHRALLEIARRTLGLATCAVYWLDTKGEQLGLVEVSTSNLDRIARDPIAVGAGAVGGACAMGRPVILARLRPDYAGLTYYDGAHGVQAFAALPILEDGDVRGVLVADRADDRPFDAADQETLANIAAQSLRHVHNERIFAMLEKGKDELARLFAASRALGEALTEDEVIAAVGVSARRVVDHDLAVLATYDERTGEHRVRHASGTGSDKFRGFAFADNAGIASAAAKTRHALPYRGQFDARTQYVFTRTMPLDGNESVMCLPLVVRDHVLGTLTLAARRRGAFPDATRQLLGVLASHAAVALSNASAVRRLEELATTDPMTGLLNKRSLESEFERRVRSAARFGKPLSLIIADIDKFKSVNDTYGHAVGDVVIKGLGAILARCKRETDVVARFGGEEFVVVCEETDVEGAHLLAERIRNELAKTVFASEMGALSVTCSLGIAEFPRDGANKNDLFARADEALYEAKHAGRNQTRVAGKRAPVVVAPTKRATLGVRATRPAKTG